MGKPMAKETQDHAVRVEAGLVILEGNLRVPEVAHGVVLFAHGSGSGPHSRRNRFVAGILHEAWPPLLIDKLKGRKGK
jgi:hypothetical protein